MNPDNDHLIYVMAVDPGGTTGVAYAVLGRKPESMWAGLAGAAQRSSYEVTGVPALQAWEIVPNYREERKAYRYNALVMEDFTVRTGPGVASKSDLLEPVRVASACEALCYTMQPTGLLRWAHIIYQSPSNAKTFATNARLRQHGVWVRGESDHQRDAMRHIAKFYADYLSGKHRKLLAS